MLGNGGTAFSSVLGAADQLKTINPSDWVQALTDTEAPPPFYSAQFQMEASDLLL